MDFGFALKAIKDGKAVSRIGWPSSKRETIDNDQMLTTKEYLYLINADNLSSEFNYGNTDDAISFTSTICLKTRDNELMLGWTPSQEDMLSNDWFVLEHK